jgi:hypothetical protein
MSKSDDGRAEAPASEALQLYMEARSGNSPLFLKKFEATLKKDRKIQDRK